MDRDNSDLADLHVHTDCSDGILSPRDVVKVAAELGLKTIAITDHDCTDGLSESMEQGSMSRVEVIPGVEISARCRSTDIHMLGYFVDPEKDSLARLLRRITSGRIERLKETIKLLRGHGVDVELEEVTSIARRGSFGRMQLARAIVEKGFEPNVQTVFSKYIRDGGPCYVPHGRVGYDEAIGQIIAAGGVAVLAHPGTMGKDEYIDRYIEAGMQGIEAYHLKHSPAETRNYLELAGRKGLLITGGSDCHGAGKGAGLLMGLAGVGYDHVEALRGAAGGDTRNVHI